MKAAYSLPLLAGAATAAPAVQERQSLDSFSIPSITTHQPNGNPAGNVNYYRIDFNVSSYTTLDGTSAVHECSTFWGDNSCTFTGDCKPYSTNVPTGEWIPCNSELRGTDDLGEFAFQLYDRFSIGDFSLSLRQNVSYSRSSIPQNEIIYSDAFHISNETSALSCDINPQEVQYQQHAHGDCSLPASAPAYNFPVTSSENACGHAESASLTFFVTQRTMPGDNVFIVGNVSALGNWDPYNAAPMNADSYTQGSPVWRGDGVELPAGESFEYKFIQWGADGELLWECGDNRVDTVGRFTCGYYTVSVDPGNFRCGTQ